MKLLADYLDMAREKSGSDYATAKVLKITKQAISHARTGRGMTPENCTKLALFLAINPMQVIAASEITKHPEKAEFWGQWVAASLAGFAILAVVVLGENPANSMDYAALLPLPFYRLCAVFV